MGFSIHDEAGEQAFYISLIMLYGVSCASEIITRFVWRVKAFLHRLKISCSMYMDDGRVVAACFTECKAKMEIVVLVFQLVGFNINFKKSHLEPTQLLKHQGFWLNSREMIYLADKDKEVKYIGRLKHLLDIQKRDTKVDCKFAALVLGSVQSLHWSHGSIVNIILRAAQNELGKAVLEGGWKNSVTFKQGVQEFEYLAKNLPLFNGKPLSNSKESGMTISTDQIEKMIRNIT